MDPKSKKIKKPKDNRWWSIGNFDNNWENTPLWKDLWDLYQILMEIGLPPEADQMK
jgi:hypothetical protein